MAEVVVLRHRILVVSEEAHQAVLVKAIQQQRLAKVERKQLVVLLGTIQHRLQAQLVLLE